MKNICFCFIKVALVISCCLVVPVDARTQAFFSPDDQLTKKFIELIRGAKKSLIGAIYLISDKSIATEFIAAKERGVAVRLVVDPMCTQNYGKAHLLAQHGVQTFVYMPTCVAKDWKEFFGNDPIMHNKFLVVDGQLLWTGSYNWTVAANRKNQENALLLDGDENKDLCTVYSNRVATLIEKFCQQLGVVETKKIASTRAQKKKHNKRECILLDMK